MISSHAKTSRAGSKRFRSGMTLIELLAYIAVLAVVTNMCAMMFVRTSRLSIIGANAVDHMNAVDSIRQDFDQTVRGATGVVDAIAGFQSDSSAVVLKLTSNAPDVQRYAVFALPTGAKKLSFRIVALHDGKLDIERSIAYPIAVSSLQVSYDSATPSLARSITLHLSTLDGHPDHRVGTDTTLTASLRVNINQGLIP